MRASVVGIYRLLYGCDFIADSIASVYDACEAVLCFVGRRPFGGRDRVRYFGHEVYFPHDIDGVRKEIERWKARHDHAGKVRVIDNPLDHVLNNQVGQLVDRYVLPDYACTHVLQVEGDEVWRPDALAAVLEAMESCDADELLASNELFWRSPRFASRRENPYAVARRVPASGGIGPTGHALMSARDDLVRLRPPGVVVHNFGYASSARTMFYKHLAALSFSRDLGLDSAPREDWFESVWLAWNWWSNRREDLCPSAGYPRAFAPAREYPIDDLPASIGRRLLEDPLPEWQDAERRQPAHAGARGVEGGP